MALKAEGAALDCFEVTLKCEEGEDEEEAMVVAVIPRSEPMLRVTQQEKTPPPRPSPLEAGSDGCEEPKQQVSWEQEFLVGSSPGGSGRALCMVCGAEIRAPSADTARSHILEQHPHTLDLSPSEKSNILEAWSEGVALLQDVRAEQPSLCSCSPTDSGQDAHPDPDSNPDPARMPAEIVVLLDSEDNPSLPKRSRPRGLRPLELPGYKGWPLSSSLKPILPPPCHNAPGSSPSAYTKPLQSFQGASSWWGAWGALTALCSHPCPAPPPGLRGTLDLQVIRVRMEEPPAVSLLQDWSRHPQGTKRVGAGDTSDWPTVLSESSTTVAGKPEKGNGV
uniref:SPIN-DOC-like zinc-finger domain-containing protein n=1 Tax=Nomascus leucogenys TaxID=61853 RepID=G1QXG3_NOMLE